MGFGQCRQTPPKSTLPTRRVRYVPSRPPTLRRLLVWMVMFHSRGPRHHSDEKHGRNAQNEPRLPWRRVAGNGDLEMGCNNIFMASCHASGALPHPKRVFILIDRVPSVVVLKKHSLGHHESSFSEVNQQFNTYLTQRFPVVSSC